MRALMRVALGLGLACTVLVSPRLGRAQSITGSIVLGQGENGLYSSAYHDGFVYFGTNTQPGQVSKINTTTFSETDVLRFTDSSLSRLHAAVADRVGGLLYLACVRRKWAGHGDMWYRGETMCIRDWRRGEMDQC